MKYGFSLLELSIVLVIIGLIAGGITAGSSMIRAAELRAGTTQIERYQIAMHLFKDKYFGLPGDLKNATAFWGEADTDPTTCIDTVGVGSQTCNGDGSGIIDWGYEMMRFWQHLANAELISGIYTGVGNSATHDGCTIGTNCPETPFSGVTAQMRHQATVLDSEDQRYGGSYKHFYYYGGAPETWDNPHIAFLTPAEMWNIDKKIDDGKPGLGKVLSYKNGATSWGASSANCATTTDSSTAEYNLTSEDVECAVILKTGF